MSTMHQELRSALSHWQAGRFRDAESAARRALRKSPDNVDALNLTGLAAMESGHFSDALVHLGRLVSLQPAIAAHHNNLGEALRRMGRVDDAIAEYRRSSQLDPQYPDAYSNLGVALDEKRLHDQAIEEYRRAIALKADHAAATNNLVSSLTAARRPDEALHAAHAALALTPNLALTHLNYGQALLACGRHDDAVAALRQAWELDPGYADAAYQLGQAYAAQDRYDLSIPCYQSAMRLAPRAVDNHYALGIALAHLGQLNEALEAFRAGTRVAPDDAQIASNVLFGLHYEPDADGRTLLTAHREWAKRFETPLLKEHRAHTNRRDPDRPLRVGYVSANFREHPVAFFLEPIITAHNRRQVVAVCYSDVINADAVTGRFRAVCGDWRDIRGKSDADVARMVRDDQIDILIDLTLHMATSRLRVFARRPAPVQATYLGYPATTGLSTMDYRLTDSHLDPADAPTTPGTEELIRLPQSYFLYRPPDSSPQIGPAPTNSKGFVTFGSYNALMKVNQRTVELWARVLQCVPGSRMLIKTIGAGCESARQRYTASFARHGIEPHRLDFQGFSRLDKAMDLLNDVDVVLDTTPFSGGTTGCHVLWMGVPVVTLSGALPVHRMGASVARNSGLGELVAQTGEQYVSIAIELARDVARRDQLRRTLRDRMRASPLMDAPGFTRAIERLYREMWTRWCSGTK
ncbi:MAG: tetratricopeptide repeat protein [Tepidisphaeraceae bacterium]